MVDSTNAVMANWHKAHISKDGKVMLINSVIMASPLYYLSVYPIPDSVLNRLSQIARKFLWANDGNSSGIPVVNSNFVETSNHLFRLCPKSQGVWSMIQELTGKNILLIDHISKAFICKTSLIWVRWGPFHQLYGMKGQVENVLRKISKSLELKEDFFVSHIGDKFTTFAIFNYYPCCSKPDLVFGLKPHTDCSLIIVILPDKDVEELQEIKWRIFKSPLYRVVTFSDKDRISIALFCVNLPEKVIGPADELVNDMRPRMYKNLKVKDYLEVFIQRFLQGKRALDWA
ncbi:codeine O-demethylase-like [Dioscorea cayenensis subsp. rotundata]|uniref:Codeine O-demethylase-like n=1 Tax=Dioscorea cayennensis subsp. rotundata TaxID=55577 RepID=A0AB40AWJ1_DIOCR|nr:codeine O-demethylase-like [Dioscorea cayenensis subsp. rotundata]